MSLLEVGDKSLEGIVELGLNGFADGLLLLDGLEDLRVVGREVGDELSLKLEDLGLVELVEVATDTAEQDGNNVLVGKGLVLGLLEELIK